LFANFTFMKRGTTDMSKQYTCINTETIKNPKQNKIARLVLLSFVMNIYIV